jgi:hypothetical protein
MKFYKFLLYQKIQTFKKEYIECEYKGKYLSRKFIYSEFGDNSIKFFDFWKYYFAETHSSSFNFKLVFNHSFKHITNNYRVKNSITNYLALETESLKYSTFILV